MSLNALDAVDDAMERTKDVIFPFDFWDWTRLAVISIFLGSSGFLDIFSNVPTGSPGTGPGSSEALTGMATAAPSTVTAGVATVLAGFVVLVLLFGYVGSVFEFVMYRSIREKKPSIRDNFKDHMVDGLKYYGFQLAYLSVLAALAVGAVLAFMQSIQVGLLSLVLVLPLFVVLSVFSGVVHDFALQELIETDKGFIESVKSSVDKLTSDWKEFAGYIGFRLVVSITVGIISGIATLAATLVLAVPVVIVALILGLLLEPLAVLVAIIGVLTWIVMILYVSVPFKAYMYSYFVELYDSFMEG